MEIIGSLFEVLVCIGAVALIIVLIALVMALLLFIGVCLILIGEMAWKGLKRAWQWLRDEAFLLYCFWKTIKLDLRILASEREKILKNKAMVIKNMKKYHL